jgi:predicted metalloprotease with PDZ domain
MKKELAIALFIASVCCNTANALTLEGSVEQTDIFHKRGFWARLFSVNEGRIGVRISSSSGLVGFVHPGSPAEKVGLQKNDKVVLVDGKKHNVDRISGDPGTIVHLDVRRGDEEFAVDVERVDYHDIASN